MHGSEAMHSSEAMHRREAMHSSEATDTVLHVLQGGEALLLENGSDITASKSNILVKTAKIAACPHQLFLLFEFSCEAIGVGVGIQRVLSLICTPDSK